MGRTTMLWIGGMMAAAMLWVGSNARLHTDNTLQRHHERPAPTASPHAIAGAYHVHSGRSHDSRVSADVWAQSAARLGLDFIVLTDHNVAPQEAQVLHDVLVLFEREASTAFGHRVEWPGGSIAAHPFDRKRPWTTSLVGLQGLEIASASAAARNLAGPTLLGILPALFMGLLRPEAGLAQLYARDSGALALWDSPAGQNLAGLCAADAHGWLPLDDELSLWRMVLPDVPRVRPLQPEQAQHIRDALMLGASSCVSGLLPPGAMVHVQRTTGGTPSTIEARIAWPARAAAPANARVRLLLDGREVCVSSTQACRAQRALPGLYRAEVDVAVPHPLWGEALLPLMYSARLQVLDDVR